MTTSTWKRARLILAISISALASMAMIPQDDGGLRYELWRQSPNSAACNPQFTGLVCAEWEYTQPFLAPTVCCIHPSAVGTNDYSACEVWLGGTIRIDDID